MKRFICLLLTICFVLSIGMISFAEENKQNNDSTIHIPEEYTSECDEKGVVQTVAAQFETGWYTEETEDVAVDVYLPHGYDKDKKYDFVLVLLPNGIYYDSTLRHDTFVSMSKIYDWMIKDNKCKPFIAASFNLTRDNSENGYRLLAYNLRNHFLPFIAENYSVYATDEEGIEGWMNNRNHTAVYGDEYGAVFAYQSCMYWNVDMFGSYYFGGYGAKLNGSSIAKTINNEARYPVNTFICGDNIGSKNYRATKDVFDRVLSRVGSLEEGKNSMFVEASDAEFDELYLAMPRLFSDNAISMVKDTHTHVIKDGACVICGRPPVFYSDNLPRRFHFDCPQKGTVETFTYTTKDYWYNMAEYEKEGMVYLPYGYDEDEKYNVMILLHGHTLNMHAFMDNIMGFDYGVRVQYRNDYDWIFYENLCRPCIIVTLNTPAEGYHQFRDMQYELRYDVLPYIANHFATYAKDGSDESLIAARDHFGLGGSSNGAGFTHGGGLYSNIAYFGSILMMSGGMHYVGHTENILEGEKEGYKLNCFIRACGSLDSLYDGVASGYRYVAKHVDYLEPGKNIFFFEVKQGHNGRVGYTALVNSLQVLFPPMDDEMDIAAFKAAEKIRNKLGLNNFLIENPTDEQN